MLESIKAPFVTRVARDEPFGRFGGLVLQALGIAAAVATFLFAAFMLSVAWAAPLWGLIDPPDPMQRLLIVVMILMLFSTLVTGAILVSMLGTTLQMWEARDPRGRRYAATLGALALLVGLSQFHSAASLAAPPEMLAIVLLLLASGAALLGIGLHPAGRRLVPPAAPVDQAE